LSRLRAATIAEPPNNLTEQTCSPWDAVKLQLDGTGHRHFPDTGWPTHYARKATAWQTTKSNAKLVTALAFNSSNNHPSPASEFIPHAAKFATVRGDLRRQLIEAHRTKDRTALVPLGTSDGITPVKNLSYDASTGAGGIFLASWSSVKNSQVLDLESRNGVLWKSSLPGNCFAEGDSLQI